MEVTIKIDDPVLREFLKSLFPIKDHTYKVNMDSFTGTVICSLTRTRGVKPRIDHDKRSVNFMLPSSHYTDSFRGKFLYVTSEGEQKINAVLKKEFDTYFYSYCTEKRIQGIQLKDAIAMFILEHDLNYFDGDIETLKKRYYRKELVLLENLNKTLQNRFYVYRRRTLKTR